MNIMKPVFLCAATVATGVLFAGDLTVGVGESVTVSADATHDNVVVNGALAVADDVTLTARSSFVVADGIDGTATVTLGEGATIEVTATAEDATKIGVGSGRAEVSVGKSALLKIAGTLNFCYGYGTTPADNAKATEAHMIVDEDAQVYCGDIFHFGGGKKPKNTKEATVTATIRLNSGATISTLQIKDESYTSKIVEFNGGEVQQRTGGSITTGFVHMPSASKNTFLYFDSIDGHEICFDLPSKEKYSAFASFGSKGSRIEMRGSGNFKKKGAGVFPFISNNSYYDNNPKSPNVRLLNTGAFTIAEGGFSIGVSNLFMSAQQNVSRLCDIVIEGSASLDWAGAEKAVVNSIITKKSAIMKNTDSNVTELTVGGDDGDTKITRIEGPIALVKTGTGKLSFCADELASFDVREGLVEFLDRAHMGYPFYRFQVDAHKAGFGSNTRMRMADFAFMNKGKDVTRPYVRLYHNKDGSQQVADPELWVDGDLTTIYYDLRAATESKIINVGVTVEYADVMPVDAYRWAPYQTEASMSDPTAWRVLGGFTETELSVLDQVAGFEVQEIEDGWLTTNFVCSGVSSALHVGTLKIGNDVKMSMKGVVVTCDAMGSPATGLELDLSAGAVIPLTENQAVAKMTIDLDKGPVSVGVLNPEAEGEIRLVGSKMELKGPLMNVTSCSSMANLRKWAVYVNGVLDDRYLVFNDGKISLSKRGTVLVVR